MLHNEWQYSRLQVPLCVGLTRLPGFLWTVNHLITTHLLDGYDEALRIISTVTTFSSLDIMVIVCLIYLPITQAFASQRLPDSGPHNLAMACNNHHRVTSFHAGQPPDGI